VDLAIPLLIVAAVLFGVGMLLKRARDKDPRAIEAQAKKGGRRGVSEPEAPDQLDLSGPRPSVVGMHVSGTEAQVTFDVPLPEGDDSVLSELLVGEAIEVLRERRHSVPISTIDTVVAFAGRPMPSEVGRASLPAAGVLPDASDAPSMLSLSAIAEDPLAADIDWSSSVETGSVVSRGDDLGPISSELRLPKAIDTGLRTQGIDPATMSAAQLVTGTLSLIGYGVIEGPVGGTWYAEKGGSRTFIREVPHSAGDHPELDDEEISRFLFEFHSAGADRGLLVTDKFGPFSVYDKERREPRVRFLTRERLQRVVDSMALG
jgi:hypothetical protein